MDIKNLRDILNANIAKNRITRCPLLSGYQIFNLIEYLTKNRFLPGNIENIAKFLLGRHLPFWTSLDATLDATQNDHFRR